MATKEFFYDILRSEYQSDLEQKRSRSVIECKSLTGYRDLITKLVQITLIADIKGQPVKQVKTYTCLVTERSFLICSPLN